MSTRGAIGFRFNGTDKIAYNRWDSYPDGLGMSLIEWLKDKTIDELKDECEDIVLVDDCRNIAWDGNGFNQEFQDAKDFLFDSLFCEYAYIINLDSNMLEFYTGFNNDENAPGRYAKCLNPCELSDGSFLYGVKLVLEIPLNEVIEGKWSTNETGFVKL